MQDKNSSSAGTRLRHNSPATDKSLKTSNYVQEVTSFEPPIPCPQHYQDNICYMCIDCRYKCLCGTCLQEGLHKNHHIKNIEKGSKIVDRVLNQSLIRLRSKSDLLTNLKDYMKIRKSEIFHQYTQYQHTFNINFDHLALVLAQKKKQILQTIDNYHQEASEKIDSLVQQINEESVMTLEMIDVVQEKIDKLKHYPTSLCLFFEDKNIKIQNMVQQATVKFQYFKKKTPDVKWVLELEIFDNYRNSMNSLALAIKGESVELCCDFYENKKQPSKKNDSKLEKVKSSYILGCKTPKIMQQTKTNLTSFKSPGINLNKKEKGKLNSMPASPSKEKSSKKRSPFLGKADQGNRKFKKGKK